jgi:DNA-directed RNA polymerase subunit B
MIHQSKMHSNSSSSSMDSETNQVVSPPEKRQILQNSIDYNKYNRGLTESVRGGIQSIVDSLCTPELVLYNTIESYNDFIRGLPEFIEQHNNKSIVEAVSGENLLEYRLIIKSARIGDVGLKETTGQHIGTPNLLKLAINTNSSLVVNIHARIGVSIYNKTTQTQSVMLKPVEMLVCKLPVMVGSRVLPVPLAKWELSGYFIVNGSQRYLINSEQAAINTPLVKIIDKNSLEVRMFCSRDSYKVVNKVSIAGSKPVSFMFRSNLINIQALRFILTHGVTMAELRRQFNYDPELSFALETDYARTPSLCGNWTVSGLFSELLTELSNSQDEKYRTNRYNYVINNYVMVHLGFDASSIPDKIRGCVSLYKQALISHLKLQAPEDPEMIVHRRIRSTGCLMRGLFSKLFYKLISNLAPIHRFSNSASFRLASLIKSDVFSNKLISAISSGNWVNNLEKVSSIVDRSNYILALSNFKKITSSMDKDLQVKGTRNLRPSHKGRICVNETPHSQSVGLVKSLCNGTIISKQRCMVQLVQLVCNTESRGTPLFVTGVQKGHSTRSVEDLRAMRLSGEIPFDVTILQNKSGIQLNSDSGRILRPLLTTAEGVLRVGLAVVPQDISWTSAVQSGAIQFYDYAEEMQHLVCYPCDLPEYSGSTKLLVELCPSLIFSIPASLIPFINHDSPAKVSVGLKTIKQAIGRFIPSHQNKRAYSRTITSTCLKNPLTTTKYYYRYGLDDYGFGENVVVAVCSHYGFNQQDAIVVNKNSISRGLFEITSFRSFAEDLVSKTGSKILGKMDGENLSLHSSEDYGTIESDGLPVIGTQIVGSKPVIGLFDTNASGQLIGVDHAKTRDVSVYTSKHSAGVICGAAIGVGREGKTSINVMLEENISGSIGDKLSSRHGQKGIISRLENAESIPYSVSTGLTPDVICNPYCVASRMTMGHLIQLLAGRTACATGRLIDGTGFSSDPSHLGSMLLSAGFKSTGMEQLRNPTTGEVLKTQIFVGCAYYMRLCWLIKQRFHCRAKGAYQMLTLQPSEGRTREGGLKVGEMERDAISAHGAAFTLAERMSSDSVSAQVNLDNHQLVNSSLINNYDTLYKTKHIVNVKIPYVLRLINNELRALHMKIELYPKNE